MRYSVSIYFPEGLVAPYVSTDTTVYSNPIQMTFRQHLASPLPSLFWFLNSTEVLEAVQRQIKPLMFWISELPLPAKQPWPWMQLTMRHYQLNIAELIGNPQRCFNEVIYFLSFVKHSHTNQPQQGVQAAAIFFSSLASLPIHFVITFEERRKNDDRKWDVVTGCGVGFINVTYIITALVAVGDFINYKLCLG